MGLAAGAAALVPAIKPFGKNKPGLLDAWVNPAFNHKREDVIMAPVKMLARESGSHLLPLAQRPF